MATFTPVLLKHKAKSGQVPVYLRIESGGSRSYLSLKISVKETEWSKRYQRVRKSHKRSSQYNSIISESANAAEEIWLESLSKNRRPSAKEIKELMSESAGGFFRYAEKYLGRLKLKNPHTYRNNLSAVRKFQSFIRQRTGQKTLALEDLSPDLLKQYIVYLATAGNKPSSQSVSLGVLKSIISDARTSGLVDASFDPFAAIKMPKSKSGRRLILTPNEIEQLRQADLETNVLAQLARDMFLFSFFCYGMRFSDVVRLKPENIRDGRVMYTPLKYGEPRSLPLRPETSEIVLAYQGGVYVFPPLSWPTRTGRKDEASRRVYINQRINKGLAVAIKAAGIDKHITFHCARHSFAAAAMSAGTSLWILQRALGHEHPTTTATYTREWRPNDLDDEIGRAYE